MNPRHSELVLRTRPPVFPIEVVRRPAVAAMLTAGTRRRGLTLVSAGPGSGKTSTVASWVRDGDADAPVGWLTLDDADNDLRTFWKDLLFAVVTSGGVPQDSPLRELFRGGFGAGEALFVRELLAELPAPVVVVLDDFQQIVSDEVLESLDGLVGRQSSPLRLVVLSRADPPLRLHRLRVSGNLTEIRGR